ncbi:MAG: Lrp/AsnC family transcriptional regulator, partial [Candidatus Binatia bacterium]
LGMLDSIDIAILSILQHHGRRHLAEIAKEVDLSPPTVMDRVKKLEARGIIKGYHAHLDAKKLGRDIVAFIGVSIGHQRYIDVFAANMMRQRDVLECHHITGDESFILKVKTANTTSLEKFLGEIRSMEGVTGTFTKIVLSTPKESQVLEMDEAFGGDFSVEGKTLEGSPERKRVAGTSRKK